MRVLLTASTFPLRRGDGSPGFVFGLARALAAHAAVRVLAPADAGAPDDETWDGVEIRRFAYLWPRRWQRLAYGDGMEVNLARSWAARAQVPGFLAAQARAVRAELRSFAPDVVNAHWLLPQGLATALALGGAGRPGHAVTLHGGDAHLLARSWLARAAARFVADRCDAFLPVSERVRSQLDAALGRPSSGFVQPMGVDRARFADAEPLSDAAAGLPGGYLLYVGRLQAIKGVDVLLEALSRVREAHPQLGLLVLGAGEREAALRAQVRSAGLERDVVLAGARPAEEVARALRGCRALVVPSLRLPDGREEGAPTVVAEGLAAGARIVATRTGGIPALVRDGQTGWLCEPGDPTALAAAIRRALASESAAQVAQRARGEAEALDWSRVAARYLEVFERISAGRARPALPPAAG